MLRDEAHIQTVSKKIPPNQGISLHDLVVFDWCNSYSQFIKVPYS